MYLFKFSNTNTRKRCEICLKLTRYENNVSDLVLESLLLTFNPFHILDNVSIAMVCCKSFIIIIKVIELQLKSQFFVTVPMKKRSRAVMKIGTVTSQLVFTRSRSKSKMETPEQCVKSVQS